GFTWARYPTGAASYEVQILADGALTPVSITVDRNWYLPTKAMALGNYSWRVRPTGSTDWSNYRPFSVTTRSTLFEVPDNPTLRARILAKPHPRSLPPSFIPMSRWGATQMTFMEPYTSRMTNEVKLQM